MSTTTLSNERALMKLASRQMGLFTRFQAVHAGVADGSIRYRLEYHTIQRCHEGVYRYMAFPTSFEQRCLAACLAVHGSAVSGRSAAVVYGHPIRPKPSRTELLLPHNLRFFGAADISVTRTRNPLPTKPWFTGRITTVGSTLMAIAPLVEAGVLERCIDHTIKERMISAPRLLTEVLERPSQRFGGRRHLITALDARSGGRLLHRSQVEQQVKGWLRRAGLDGSRPNFVTHTGFGNVEVDFVWLPQKIGLELSPFYTHGSQAQQNTDTRRRRSLVASGWRLIEATDPDLVDFAAFQPVAQTLHLLLGSAAA
jgi:very-short-patch-repair endonuclease